VGKKKGGDGGVGQLGNLTLGVRLRERSAGTVSLGGTVWPETPGRRVKGRKVQGRKSKTSSEGRSQGEITESDSEGGRNQGKRGDARQNLRYKGQGNVKESKRKRGGPCRMLGV